MSHDALRQRNTFLVEHGGLWEQARESNATFHRLILAGVALAIVLQIVEIAILLH